MLILIFSILLPSFLLVLSHGSMTVSNQIKTQAKPLNDRWGWLGPLGVGHAEKPSEDRVWVKHKGPRQINSSDAL